MAAQWCKASSTALPCFAIGEFRLSSETIMKILIFSACLALAAQVMADDCTTVRGRTVCGNGQQAAGVNRNTGRAFQSEKNNAGVTTTQGNRGGEAKTKNGKGVYRSPGGTTCVKGANAQGCR
jgi:hypothetical protein